MCLFNWKGLCSSYVNQPQSHQHKHKTEFSQDIVRHLKYFVYPKLHFFRKCKIWKPFHDHHHSKNAQEKFHYTPLLFNLNKGRDKFIMRNSGWVLLHIFFQNLICQNKIPILFPSGKYFKMAWLFYNNHTKFVIWETL